MFFFNMPLFILTYSEILFKKGRIDKEQLTIDKAQWTMDNGQGTRNNEQWTRNKEQ